MTVHTRKLETPAWEKGLLVRTDFLTSTRDITSQPSRLLIIKNTSESEKECEKNICNSPI